MKITVDGKEYTLSPLGMWVLFGAEDEIRQNETVLVDTVRQVEGMTDLAAKSALLGEAFRYARRVITIDECVSWIQSSAGIAYSFWCSLKVFHVDMGRDDAKRIFDQITPQQLADVTKYLSKSSVFSDEDAPQ